MSASSGDSDSDINFHLYSGLLAGFAFFFLSYVVIMYVVNRQRLYHSWNHLAVYSFTFYAINALFMLCFVSSRHPTISCGVAKTLYDICVSTASFSFIAMFCVMMFQIFQEPEKKRLAAFEYKLFTGLLALLILQTGIYAGIGDFKDFVKVHNASAPNGTMNIYDPHLCRLRRSQIVLPLVFRWIPDFLLFLLSIAFIYWLRARKNLLNRRRVNIFAFLLLSSTASKTFGVGFEIHSVDAHWDPEAEGLSAAKILFIAFAFYTFHTLLMSLAFFFAEDLVPQKVRECCDVCDETSSLSRFDDEGGGAGSFGASTYSPGHTNAASSSSGGGYANDTLSGDSSGNDNNYGTSTGGGGGGGAQNSTCPTSPYHPHNQQHQQQQQQQQQQAGRSSVSSNQSSSAHLHLNDIHNMEESRNLRHTLTYFLHTQRTDILHMTSSSNLRGSVAIKSESGEGHFVDTEEDDLISNSPSSKRNFTPSSAPSGGRKQQQQQQNSSQSLHQQQQSFAGGANALPVTAASLGGKTSTSEVFHVSTENLMTHGQSGVLTGMRN